MARTTFSLRLADPRVREAVREISEHEHMSQNEYIEQAIRNDLVVRGQLRAEQLRTVADRLAAITDDAYESLVERSLIEFAEGESHPDPAEMRAFAPREARGAPHPARSTRTSGILEAVAAFGAGR
jgi:hypothetical protein